MRQRVVVEFSADVAGMERVREQFDVGELGKLQRNVLSADAPAVCDADGRLVAWSGDPDRPLYSRSSMKPLQAAVSLSAMG